MASKRRLRRTSCEGKQRFETAAEALTAIGRLRASTGDIARYNTYRCQFCRGLHFGHAPGSSRFMGSRTHR